MNLNTSNPPTITQLYHQALLQHPQTIHNYRQLHQIPEIGLQEHQTSSFIRQYLSNIEGLEVMPPISELTTAVIASISPPQPTQTILLRCELDALPFKQESKLPFAAENGLHHACGHDGHMAVMLSAIKIVSKERAFLKKKVVFCFQPGEEGRQGAHKLFLYYPSLTEAVKYCFALHFNNSIYPGSIKLESGSVTALSNRFTIKIEGKSVHCLTPETAIDANFIGATLVTQLYALPTLTVPALEGSSLTVMKVEGGSMVSKVSDTFQIVACVRTFSYSTYERLRERIISLATSFCSGFGAKVTINFNQINYRSVVNDDQLVASTRSILSQNQEFKFVLGQKSLAGQDFCEFSQRRPSCYIGVGAAPANSVEGSQKYAPHSPVYKLDESALLVGLKIWLAIIFG